MQVVWNQRAISTLIEHFDRRSIYDRDRFSHTGLTPEVEGSIQSSYQIRATEIRDILYLAIMDRLTTEPLIGYSTNPLTGLREIQIKTSGYRIKMEYSIEDDYCYLEKLTIWHA